MPARDWTGSATILNYRHSQQRDYRSFFALPGSLHPGARFVPGIRPGTVSVPGRGLQADGNLEELSLDAEDTRQRQGRGRAATPPWRYPPRSTPWGDPGEEPVSSRFSLADSSCPSGKLTSAPLPGHGFPLDIAMTAPPSHGDIHHGPVSGEIPGKNQLRGRFSPAYPSGKSPPALFLARLPTGYRKHCPCPREGAGEEREARAGWGCRRSVWVCHLREARVGWGLPERNVRVPTCGAGETPSPVPTPRRHTPTVHSMGRPRRRTGYGFPPDIAMTAPAPGRGRGRSAKRGRGLPERNVRISGPRRLGATSTD